MQLLRVTARLELKYFRKTLTFCHIKCLISLLFQGIDWKDSSMFVTLIMSA